MREKIGISEKGIGEGKRGKKERIGIEEKSIGKGKRDKKGKKNGEKQK